MPNRYRGSELEGLATLCDFPVDVDGRTMNINVQGEGDRAVVILPGRGVTAPSYDFAPLIAELKGDARVVTVDYFGSGLSDMTDQPRTSEEIVHEVHTALQALGILQFTLVAHSISGIYGLHYANIFPDEVAAFVGIDTATPGMDKLITPELIAETTPPESPADQPHDVADDVADVVGYVYSNLELQIMERLHARNIGNDDIFEAIQSGGDKSTEKPYDKMRFPDGIPTLYYLSSESATLAPWYEGEHLAQCTANAASGVNILDGGHFLHHSQSGVIGRGVLDIGVRYVK